MTAWLLPESRPWGEARYLPSRRGGPELLSSPQEVDEFIDRLLAQPEEYNLASLYLVERLNPDDRFPSHQFQVGVHYTRGLGALKYVDANGGFASWAPWDADSSEPVYFNYVGTESEFRLPRRSPSIMCGTR